MTYYTTTDNKREIIFFVLAAISISLSSALLLLDLQFIYKIIVPSGFLINGLLILLFDKCLWKTKWMYSLLKIPNLNGNWSGVNTLTDSTTEILRVVITQTWLKIDIEMKTDNTISNICSATIYIDTNSSKFIKYIYIVKPIKPDTLYNAYGEGCTELRIVDDNGIISLEGSYFSSKFRGGHFTLKRNLLETQILTADLQ